MFKKHYSVKDMINQIKGNLSYNMESLNENEFYVEGKDKYHSRDQFSNMFYEIIKEHHEFMLLEIEKLSLEIEKLSRKNSQEGQDPKEAKEAKEIKESIDVKLSTIKSQFSDLALITYDDVAKYYDAFVNSRDKLKDKQKDKIDISR